MNNAKCLICVFRIFSLAMYICICMYAFQQKIWSRARANLLFILLCTYNCKQLLMYVCMCKLQCACVDSSLLCQTMLRKADFSFWHNLRMWTNGYIKISEQNSFFLALHNVYKQIWRLTCMSLCQNWIWKVVRMYCMIVCK